MQPDRTKHFSGGCLTHIICVTGRCGVEGKGKCPSEDFEDFKDSASFFWLARHHVHRLNHSCVQAYFSQRSKQPNDYCQPSQSGCMMRTRSRLTFGCEEEEKSKNRKALPRAFGEFILQQKTRAAKFTGQWLPHCPTVCAV